MNVLSKLIVPSRAPDPDGLVVQVTPASAGWTYVGFEVFKMKAGRSLHRPTGDREACLVLLSGRANVATSGATFRDIGERMTVFERIPPYSVYVPSQDAYTVEALTDLELAVCLAPGSGGRSARLIAPERVGKETRGSGNLERYIHHILPEQEPADSLLVVEVFTPNGHWSSYAPHKHDRDALPEESLLSFVWSPQPVSSRAPATAIADTAANRGRAAVVRRVELAVMVVPPADGWGCR